MNRNKFNNLLLLTESIINENKGASKSLEEIINEAKNKIIIAFDTETTGLDPNHPATQLTEIAAIAIDLETKHEQTYHDKINLTDEVKQIIRKEKKDGKPFFGNRKIIDNLKMTGYTDKNTNFKDEDKALKGFVSFINSFPSDKTFIMAHNLQFDMKQINTRLKYYNLPKIKDIKTIDTLIYARNQLTAILKAMDDKERSDFLFKKLLIEKEIKRGEKIIKVKKRSNTLSSLGKAFDVKTDFWHSGIADVKQLIGIYFKLISFFEEVKDAIDPEIYQDTLAKCQKKARADAKGWQKKSNLKQAKLIQKAKAATS